LAVAPESRATELVNPYNSTVLYLHCTITFELRAFKAIILDKEISITTALWAKGLVILIAISMGHRKNAAEKSNFRNHGNKVNVI
jgi:hypothetical protein